jgi:hypothetical protein
MGKGGAPFILTLLGGIFELILGLGTAIFLYTEISTPTIVNNKIVQPELWLYLFPMLGVWIAIMSILAIRAAFKMKSDDPQIIKKAGITAIIAGFLCLTINIVIIIGGFLAIVKGNQIITAQEYSQQSAQQQVQQPQQPQQY